MDHWNFFGGGRRVLGALMKNRLILVGGGAFARELMNWADHLYGCTEGKSIHGFLDESPNVLESFNYQISYLGKIDNFQPAKGEKLLIGIGDPAGKKRIYEMLKLRGGEFLQLIHPTAVVANTAKLGEGVVVCPHSLVSADAIVGDGVAINALSSVGHDVVLGNFCTLSAHVDLTGSVEVGERVFFGTGAKVLPKAKIGSGAKIGAGAIIMRSVPENGVMYAQPAKKL